MISMLKMGAIVLKPLTFRGATAASRGVGRYVSAANSLKRRSMVRLSLAILTAGIVVCIGATSARAETPVVESGSVSGESLPTALDQGLPLILRFRCDATNLGAFAPCRSYAIRYRTSDQGYTASGPVAPAMYQQTDTRRGDPVSLRRLNVWGAIFEYDEKGDVRWLGQSAVIGSLYLNPIALALERGLSVTVQLHASVKNVGGIAPGQPYSLRYSRLTHTYTATGPVFQQGYFQVASYVALEPLQEKLSLWGVIFEFDRFGRLSLPGAGEVGTISADGFAAEVFPLSSNKYVTTSIRRSDTCWDAGVNWNLPKTPLRTEIESTSLALPVQWNSFQGEVHQAGYRPLFNPGRVSIAPNGRPLIRDRNLNLQILTDQGQWKKISLLDIARESLKRQGISWEIDPVYQHQGAETDWLFNAGPGAEERIVFDNECHAYTVIDAFRSSLGSAILLHSPDGGHSWAAYVLEGWSGDGSIDMEIPTSQIVPLEHPPVLSIHGRLERSSSANPDDFRLVALIPEKRPDGSLKISGPHTIATDSVLVTHHSGGDSYIASQGDLVHFVYPGNRVVTDPIENRLGTPQYAVSFSRSKERLVTSPVLLGVGLNGPRNQAAEANPGFNPVDAHNAPVMAKDDHGFLHVVLPGHAARMLYRRSLAPNRIDAGWSSPENFGLQVTGAQDFSDTYSYPSLIVDSDGYVHVMARWSGNEYVNRLVYLKRSPSGAWNRQQVLLNPGRSYYGVWYHKLSIDPWGRLFLSYSYAPGNFFSGEAALFSASWGLRSLRKLPNPDGSECRETLLGAAPTNYCEYTGFVDVGPGIAMSRFSGDSFIIATTRSFFQF